MKTDIYLLRHGATPANLENRFAGRTDEPLHREGEAQIRKVAATLGGTKITRIFSGPLRRTRQSAAILSTLIGAPVRIEAAFNEISLPHWDGLAKEVIIDRFGEEYPTWLTRPASFRCPNGESLAAVQKRAVAGMERIMTGHAGQRVIVVSHLIVLRCLALHYLGQDLNDFRKITIGNGDLTLLSRRNGVSTVTFPPAAPQPRPTQMVDGPPSPRAAA